MEWIGWLLTGGAVPGLIGGVGIFFWILLGGRPMRSPGRMVRSLKNAGGEEGRSPAKAMCLALAGTLGVGNIVGVADALAVGGAGAVFWMWISAVFASVLKYAEILLGVAHRRSGKSAANKGGKSQKNSRFYGGACYYIEDCFAEGKMPRLGKFLSKAFACLMILNAFGMGCILQVRAMSEAVEETWSLPPIAFGIGLALLLLPILVRGNERIAGITEKLVPLMSGAFLALSAAVLIGNRARIPEAFSSIFREAFAGLKVVKNAGQGSGIRGKIAPVAGGILGFLTSRTVRIGTVRGLLSNEAGCGTAPTAHASAENTPADQGIWGIFEVVADTLILCTATALVLLTSEEAAPGGAGGMAWVLEAFSKSLPALGSLPGVTVTLCVIFFGSATVLCWADYASESLGFLTTRPLPRRILLALLILSIPSAALISSDRIFALSDFTLSSLTLLNLLTLLLAAREVKRETERWNGE